MTQLGATSKEYGDVLPELTRAAAESTVAIVPTPTRVIRAARSSHGGGGGRKDLAPASGSGPEYSVVARLGR